MQIEQQQALADVLRCNARLSSAMNSRDKDEQAKVPQLRRELGLARVILAVERGLADYVRRGGSPDLTAEQTQAMVAHLQNRSTRCTASTQTAS